MIRAPCNFEAARGDVVVLLKRTKPNAPSGIASARGIILIFAFKPEDDC